MLDILHDHVHIHPVYSPTRFLSIGHSASVHHAPISVCNALNSDMRAYAIWRGPGIAVASPGSIAVVGACRGIVTWVSGARSLVSTDK
jgi:hypothetical protein